MRRSARLYLWLLPAIVLPAVAAPAAHAAKPLCPSVKRALYRSAPNVTIWAERGSVYACWYRRSQSRPRVSRRVRLGAWRTGSQLRYDAATTTAVWTLPGAGGDRIWARTLGAGPALLAGVMARPAMNDGAAGQEGRVLRLVADAGVAAWVAWDKTSGVNSVYVAQLGAPEAVSASSGFPLAPVSSGRLTHMGDWPATSRSVAATLVVLDDGTGDGDECGGGSGFIVSVTPLAPATLTVAGTYSYGSNFYC